MWLLINANWLQKTQKVFNRNREENIHQSEKKIFLSIHLPFSVKKLLSLTCLSLTIFIYNMPLFQLFSPAFLSVSPDETPQDKDSNSWWFVLEDLLVLTRAGKHMCVEIIREVGTA